MTPFRSTERGRFEYAAPSVDTPHLLAVHMSQRNRAIEHQNADDVHVRFQIDHIDHIDLNRIPGLRFAPFPFKGVHGLPLLSSTDSGIFGATHSVTRMPRPDR